MVIDLNLTVGSSAPAVAVFFLVEATDVCDNYVQVAETLKMKCHRLQCPDSSVKRLLALLYEFVEICGKLSCLLPKYALPGGDTDGNKFIGYTIGRHTEYQVLKLS